MAEQLKNGKWSPVVWRDGFVNMVELVGNDYKIIECNTQQQAEEMEKQYYKFWN